MDLEAEFQIFLDAISDCFPACEFAGWRDRIILPFSMITDHGPREFETEDELRANFEHYLSACRILRIDMIYRKPLALESGEDGRFLGTYETNLLSNGKRATAPYTSSALLEMTPEGFKMRSILNARGHQDWTGSTG
ncbi:hypothetical protein [Litoreibacter janthinus]|uniref:SnoaL-like domain-containing protein n=1 Tax=Litoreibacter janthinus TaxID=670154 RepID=A0A1I6GP32_9RHOB|nr:hypothetical protein [Litoreibacter janthinus]SFR43817.1 hypothetical protein SAMN04488002_1768 [Litoreibacter janthinus]